MPRSLAAVLSSLAFTLSIAGATAMPLPAQKVKAAEPGDPVPEIPIPPLTNGDGRQRLSEYRGQPVLIVTVSSAVYGADAADRAIRLAERHGKDGLVVMMTYLLSPGQKSMDIEALALRAFPGRPVRMCLQMPWGWNWDDLGWPPYYVVIGPDGRMVQLGSMSKGPKAIDKAVAVAMQQHALGWGADADEIEVRRLLYAKGALAAARQQCPDSMGAEVDAVFARRLRMVEYQLDQGHWARGKAEAVALQAAAAGIDSWSDRLAALAARIGDAAADHELALEAQLDRLLQPFQKKTPTRDVQARLRKFAAAHQGTSVGARTQRLVDTIEQALAID